MGIGQNPKIGGLEHRLEHRLEIGVGSTDPPTMLLVHLIIAEAILAFRVIVGVAPISGLSSCPD